MTQYSNLPDKRCSWFFLYRREIRKREFPSDWELKKKKKKLKQVFLVYTPHGIRK
jgi:hypothetical protein